MSAPEQRLFEVTEIPTAPLHDRYAAFQNANERIAKQNAESEKKRLAIVAGSLVAEHELVIQPVQTSFDEYEPPTAA